MDLVSQEKIQEELNSNFDSFLLSYSQLISTEKISLSDTDTEKDPNTVYDTVKGTYIKTANSIQLSKYDHSFCYDSTNKVYYLMSNSSLVTQSILVANTYENYYSTIKNKLLNSQKDNSEETLLNSLLTCTSYNDFWLVYTNILLLINTKKPDLLWKYRNWNYYYNNLFDQVYNVSAITIYLKLKQF